MNPIYLDLHIHTSDDPSSLNENYDLDLLTAKVKSEAQGNDFLISLTDHNVINEKVYLEAIKKIAKNIILGVELHIRAHKNEDAKAYHCHIYFNFDNAEITAAIIKELNSKLDILYPNKKPSLSDTSIPDIQDILEMFDEYDFVLLPHGGQTHATFDEALPKGRKFDNAMQRSVYYNFFDGFTSRSNQGTEKTTKYLEKLGVQEFVNLVTGTDNYDPKKYPRPKQSESLPFIPTWMLAAPTFAGLRLSLSDNSRLIYSNTKPKKWRESIKSVKLQKGKIDVDVNFTPGLNVVIGESSSGKTLLVDSVVRKITGSGFEDSPYINYGVDSLEIVYPERLHPHYIHQNYITTVTIGERKINEIPIISKILPENKDARKAIDKGKKDLNEQLSYLFETVERIEVLEDEIERIPILSTLVISEKVKENILKYFLSVVSSLKNANYSSFQEKKDLEFLDDLDLRLANNPFIKHNKKLIGSLKDEINGMREYAFLEDKIKNIIRQKKEEIDTELEIEEGESQRKKNKFDDLVDKMKEYYECLIYFEQILEKISSFSVEAPSGVVEIEGYKLSVENKFKLNKNIVLEEFNRLLLSEYSIPEFNQITPDKLFKSRFKNNQKGNSKKTSSPDYVTTRENINNNIIKNDDIKYKIFTPEKEDFDLLSPGRRTAIILHLILNFEGDSAPLIIDQPEDNLATSYMNDGLVKSIKKMKNKKQIIFVSHNATIPMAGDAQNIILCKNDGGKIQITSNPLEGKIGGVDMVDYIAKIADGGKSSIKKRFKKYNLKKFKE